MKKAGFGRVVGFLAVMFVVAAPLAVAATAFASDPSAQSTATVANGEELRQQWAIGNNTLITLTANIDLGLDGNGQNICDVEPLRNSSNLSKAITVDGQGLYGITQTCKGERVLRDHAGGETVTLKGLTHFTGGHASGHGGGLRNDGPVNVVDSNVSANFAYGGVCYHEATNGPNAQDLCEDGDGGGVYAGPNDAGTVLTIAGYNISVTHSTIQDNEADDDGGGVYTEDVLTVTDSAFNANIAHGNALEGGNGGGAYAHDGVTVTGSSFDSNDAQCGVSDQSGCQADSDGGGFHTFSGASVTGSTFTANHAYDSGGGFFSTDAATVVDSTFTANNAGGETPQAQSAQLPSALAHHVSASDSASGSANCDCIGGGFAVVDSGAEVSGSTFIGNGAGCDQGCFGSGGGFFSNADTSVVGSTFGDGTDNGSNAAGCFFGCGAMGGGFYSGGATDVAGSTFLLNGDGCLAECIALGGGFYGASGGRTLAESAGVPARVFEGDVSVGESAPGAVTVTESTFTANEAGCIAGVCFGTGGGFYANSPTAVHVTASTFNGNDALFGGGAFSVNGQFGGLNSVVCVADCGPAAAVTVVNSTVTGNKSGFPAAIDVAREGDTLSLVNDTIDANLIVERVFNFSTAVSQPKVAQCECWAANVSAADLTSTGTVITHPRFQAAAPTTTATPEVVNCWVGDSSSEGYNFSDDDSCDFSQATDNVATGNDPKLGALADNGGPTQTMLPQTDSPLIDAIPPASCQVDVDQRGVSRPQMKGCDIGSVEVRGASLDVTKVVTGTAGNSVPANGYSFAVSCSDGTTATLTVANATNGGTSSTVDDIVPGSTCTVTEAAVVYTNPLVVVQPQVTYNPATGAPLAEGEAATVTVTNNYEGVNLLGLLVIRPETPLVLQPKFTG